MEGCIVSPLYLIYFRLLLNTNIELRTSTVINGLPISIQTYCLFHEGLYLKCIHLLYRFPKDCITV